MKQKFHYLSFWRWVGIASASVASVFMLTGFSQEPLKKSFAHSQLNASTKAVERPLTVTKSNDDVKLLHPVPSLDFKLDKRAEGEIWIVGLTDRGKAQSVLTIPDGISRIYANAFSGCSPNLEQIIFDHYDPKLVIEYAAFYGTNGTSGVPKTTTFYVPNWFTMYHPLNLAGIDQKQIVSVNVVGDLLVKERHYERDFAVGLLGVTNEFRNSHKSKLVIPENVTYIGSDVFHNCTALKTIEFSDKISLTDDKIEKDAFKGLTNQVSLRTHNDDLTKLLAKRFTHLTIDQGIGNFFVDVRQKNKLDGLTVKGLNETGILEIPSNIDTIADGALAGTKAKQIKFLHEGPVKINGKVPNVTYDVYDYKTAKELAKQGVSQKIDVRQPDFTSLWVFIALVLAFSSVIISVISLRSNRRLRQKIAKWKNRKVETAK